MENVSALPRYMVKKNVPDADCAFDTEATKIANSISLILSEKYMYILT